MISRKYFHITFFLNFRFVKVKMSFTTCKLKSVFKGEKPKGLVIRVKVLSEISNDLFRIADESGHCKLMVKNAKPYHVKRIVEGKFLKIMNPELDHSEKKLIVRETSEVFLSQEFSGVVSPNGNGNSENESENDDESEKNSQ